MCRHLAWLGRPRTLASLMLQPPHGLLRQSYAPRRQAHGRLNADGWGVGFYPPEQSAPARWRSERPLWSDQSFAAIAPLLSSGSVVCAVRSATAGMPIEPSATAPFTDGHWLLSHNGRVDRAVLPTTTRAESVCDSALLAAHVFATGPAALADTIRRVSAQDAAARLNVLVADTTGILASTWGDTLSYLAAEDGVCVASEPYDDDPRWTDVPDRHLLAVSAAGITLTPLET